MIKSLIARLRRIPVRTRRTFVVTAVTIVVVTSAVAGWSTLADRQPEGGHGNVAGDIPAPNRTDEPERSSKGTPIPSTSSSAPAGFTLDCDDPRVQGPSSLGGSFNAICDVRSSGGFVGDVELSCVTPAWVTCNFIDERLTISPGRSAEARADVRIGEASPGSHVLVLVGTSGGVTRSAQLPFDVSEAHREPYSFSCGSFERMLAGETKTTSCTFDSNGFRGTFHPACGVNVAQIQCELDRQELVVNSDEPIKMVVTWTSDVILTPKKYLLHVELEKGTATDQHFEITVPEPTGSYAIACAPEKIEMPSTGTKPISCTVTSHGGFDGYVDLYGWASVQGWTMSIPTTKVRVAPGTPATVTIPFSTQNVPPGSYPRQFGVQGEVYEYSENNQFISVDVY